VTRAYPRDGIKILTDRYQLDIKKQVLVDLEEKRSYKISGNTFASDIAATLVADEDFQPDYTNFGLFRCGNRYYCAAIDKEAASFQGESYDVLQAKAAKERISSDGLYVARTQDQALAIVQRIADALIVTSGQCDFDRIFLNPRVLATGMLAEKSAQYCENLKVSAHSLLDHYEQCYGKNYLAEFAEREKLRQELANSIIQELQLPQEMDRLIIEDLRGVYYQEHFTTAGCISASDLKNDALRKALTEDLRWECGMTHRKLVR
jgi:hypothetical protein